MKLPVRQYKHKQKVLPGPLRYYNQNIRVVAVFTEAIPESLKREEVVMKTSTKICRSAVDGPQPTECFKMKPESTLLDRTKIKRD